MSLISQAEPAPSAPVASVEAEEGKEEAITFSPMAEEVSGFVLVFVYLCIFVFFYCCIFIFLYFVHSDGRGGE